MTSNAQFAQVAALSGDPARATMLHALMDGRALTATELARAAGVTPQTASGHLARMTPAGLLRVEKQGRHHYHRIAGPSVARMIESMMQVAAELAPRARPVAVGPRDAALRRARTCYDHLAGDLAVKMFDRLLGRKLLTRRGDELKLTREGRDFFECAGIDVETLGSSRRPLCRQCLDWSERRSHLGGTLGAAVLDHVGARRWAVLEPRSRIVRFTPTGEQKMTAWFSR